MQSTPCDHNNPPLRKLFRLGNARPSAFGEITPFLPSYLLNTLICIFSKCDKLIGFRPRQGKGIRKLTQEQKTTKLACSFQLTYCIWPMLPACHFEILQKGKLHTHAFTTEGRAEISPWRCYQGRAEVCGGAGSCGLNSQ